MLSIKHVQTIVTEQFGLTCAQLLGRSHLPRIVLARHIAMLLCLEMVRGASLPVVATGLTVITRRYCMPANGCAAGSPPIRKFAKQVDDLRRIIGAFSR